MARYKPRQKRCPVQLASVGNAKAALKRLAARYQPPAALRETTERAKHLLSQMTDREQVDNKLRFELAALLRTAKESVNHGEYESWYQKGLGLKRRNAQKLFKAGELFGDQKEIFSQLTANQIYALAAASDSIVAEAKTMAAGGTLDRAAAKILIRKSAAETAANPKPVSPAVAAKADRIVELFGGLEGPVRNEIIALLCELDRSLVLARLNQLAAAAKATS